MAKETHVLIKERRKEMGLRQTDLAERLGVSQPSVSAWEKGGDIPEDHLKKIADVLELPFQKLLGEHAHVYSSSDTAKWREIVFGDMDLDPHAQLVLLWISVLAEPAPVSGLMEYSGSIARVAQGVRALTEPEVKAAWPDVLASPYVASVSDAEWHLRLVLPRQ